ncbi:protease modulator HflC [Luteolibacter pohnpeiensis]|uniref:Protein HflC n=1 Tax=Luteolibacter pohnpeiensis TaxID=454153 RepID=A0A934VUU5_9BACT|nr:protease modulator HflC [Luteolibacter pohnpeiensis]MBK1881123.1 protease modulator HflC [Luteolibacter pohnpeiensis]
MKTILAFVFGLFVLLFIVSTCTYTVSPTEQAFITEFGKPVGKPINSDPNHDEAGIHFKKPFIQKVNRIEKRILQWDGPATEMPTRDKLYISVDNFARWRIVDPIAYYEQLRDERSALSRLDDIIGGETRNAIASHDLIEVVRSRKDRQPVRDESLTGADSTLGTLPPIQYGRAVIDEQILKAAQSKVSAWGIEIIDVRFKRINYKSGVIEKIYARMASERLQIAERFRSEGAGAAAKIIGRKDRDLLSIQSEAYRKEQEIKGKADAQATGIYASAYNTSPTAADFYQFNKTLDTYRMTLGKDSTAIFTTNSDLFHLMKRIDPDKR